MASIIDGGDAFSEYDSPPGYAPSSRTVAEVAQAVKRQFGDESGVQLEDADIIRWTNDAMDVIVSRNKAIKAKSTTEAIPGQGAYRFPVEGIHQIESVHVGNTRVPNVAFASAETSIMASDPDRVMTGVPSFWYEWGGEFVFWPAPSDSFPITLYYSKRPTAVNALSDLLEVPDKYYPLIVTYVLNQAYEMDEDMPAAQVKREQFDQGLGDFAEEERTAQNMTFDVITIFDN